LDDHRARRLTDHRDDRFFRFADHVHTSDTVYGVPNGDLTRFLGLRPVTNGHDYNMVAVGLGLARPQAQADFAGAKGHRRGYFSVHRHVIGRHAVAKCQGLGTEAIMKGLVVIIGT